MDRLLLLGGAGLLAGGMNALAGGGSFVTLPALIAAGVPPVNANASSSIALYPGSAASAFVYRADLRGVAGVGVARLLLVSLIGGAAGSLLLLATPARMFDQVLPWLLLVATLALAFGRRLGARLRGSIHGSAAAMLPTQFLLAVYGGYFGGAVGLMMMAAWSVLDGGELKALNAPRTVMVTAANTASLFIFAAARAVWWPEAAAMAVCALAGGYLGAHLGRRLDPRLIRACTLAVAVGMTLAFFRRAYAG